MTDHAFTVGHLFCGSGLGALGFMQSEARIGAHRARFRTIGGVDVDPAGCRDFTRFTGAPALCADVHALTPVELRAAWGDRRPDVLFLSPPCKGFSRLISKSRAAEEKYQKLNELVVEGVSLAMLAWDSPPPLLLLENVEGIRTRGAALLVRVRQLLLAHGYRLQEGMHDCGEVGGLAQHRRRYLLVARREAEVPNYVYKPPLQRVRACGEVLGPLPLPDDPAGGPMHRLPRVKLVTWVRLAMTRAGKDWRDLPRRGETLAAWWARLYEGKDTGAGNVRLQVPPELTSPVGPGEKDREHFGRHDVRPWEAPARTVAGSGSNGGEAIADPRVGLGHEPRNGSFGVTGWEAPGATVTGSEAPGRSNTPAAVADPRVVVDEERFHHSGRVAAWSEAAGTVTTSPSPSSGAIAAADPRVVEAIAPGRTADQAGGYKNRPHYLGIESWREPTRAITGEARTSASSGVAAVVDERVAADPEAIGRRYHNQHAVASWAEPSPTVIGATRPGSGAVSVSDPRGVPLTCHVRNGAYGVTSEDEPAATVTGSACIDNGPVALADSRASPPWPTSYRLLSLDAALAMVARGEELPAGVVPVIPSPHDGFWHRPLTTLELAVLQGMDWNRDGAPLVLDGTSTAAWRERIGNGVPVGAARAAGNCHLRALLVAALGGAFELAVDPVWVREERAVWGAA